MVDDLFCIADKVSTNAEGNPDERGQGAAGGKQHPITQQTLWNDSEDFVEEEGPKEVFKD